MLIDTHAHLNFNAYNSDRDEVIKRCQERGMAIINVGAQFESSQRAVELSKNNNFYASIGLHPIHVYDEDFSIFKYQALIDEKVVAMGETGFDYYHITFNRDNFKGKTKEEIIKKQKEVFFKHLELALKNDLAVVLHGRNGIENREVYQEMLGMIIEQNFKRAVFHCYGGSLAIAKKIVSAGYYIGIDGPVTFKKKVEELQEIVKAIPLEKILIETDSPYLTPEPHRGDRNEPIFVEYVAEKVAELKGLTKEEVIEATWQNAKNLFRLE